jgi:cytidylate kinase
MGEDARERIVITIDGPAGTGKSTVAHRLAQRLGLEFLDTGAMYRAAALVALEAGIDPADGAVVAQRILDADLHFDWSATPPRLMLGERVVTEEVRDRAVNDVVSVVAAQKEVRAVLVERQRRIADAHPRLVSEGRDQGSVVFPDAPVRFYLDADVEVRARRRLDQLAAAGMPADESTVISGIRARDRIDSARAEGPLIKPEGAIVVDTGTLTLEQVVDRLEADVRDRLPSAVLTP